MKKFQKITAFATVFGLLLSVSGCGTKDSTPTEIPETQEETREALSKDSAEGWWVRPEGYQRDFYDTGVFCIELQDSMLTFYDSFGELEEMASYEVDDGAVWFWAERNLGPFELDGDTMRNLYTGDAEFVRVDAPNFADVENGGGYAGKWFLFGETQGEFYEISGNTIRKNGESDEFTVLQDQRMLCGQGEVPQVTVLHTENMHTDLLAIPNQPMLVYDGVPREVYLREDAAQDPWMLEQTAMVYSLLNGRLESRDLGDGIYYMMEFYPEGFSVCTMMASPGGGYVGDHTQDQVGTWELADDSTVILSYADGSTDTLEIPWTEGNWEILRSGRSWMENPVLDGQTCYLESQGNEFTYHAQ